MNKRIFINAVSAFALFAFLVTLFVLATASYPAIDGRILDGEHPMLWFLLGLFASTYGMVYAHSWSHQNLQAVSAIALITCSAALLNYYCVEPAKNAELLKAYQREFGTETIVVPGNKKEASDYFLKRLAESQEITRYGLAVLAADSRDIFNKLKSEERENNINERADSWFKSAVKGEK